MKQKILIADDCIVKAYDNDELLVRVGRLLKRSDAETSAAKEEKRATGPHVVLTVDDEPSVRKVIARVLRSTYPQCRVEEAGDLPQAKQKLLDLQPKLVISDLYLPSGNGLDLCHFIQEHPWFYRTRVLVITSYPSRQVRESAFEQGACEFLPKPFHAEDLAGSIGRLLA